MLAARNENLRRVELAWGAVISAEWAHFVALGVYAYRTGGASAVGLAGLVRLLPAAFVAPVAASVGDRLRRERFLSAALLLAVLALAGSAVAASLDIAGGVYVGAAVVGVATTLIRPTVQAILPAVARTPEQLIAANGASSTIESLATFGGPLVTGVLLATSSVAVVLAAAAAVVAAGAVLIIRVRTEPRISTSVGGGRAGHVRTLRQPWTATHRVPASRLVLGLMVVQTFVRGCLNVLIVVLAFRLLHAGAGAVGYLSSAIGVGGLIGALWAMTLRLRRLATALALSLVLWGLPIALMAAHSWLIANLALLAILGAANSTEDVAGFTLVQRVLPTEALNGVLACFWGLAMAAVAAGSVVAPALVNAIGVRWTLVAVGLLLPAAVAVAYPTLTRLDRSAAPSEELRVIERVPLFAPLSLASKERLAANLVPVTFEPGETVVRSGETGDRFYIVGEGEVDVDAGGRHKALTAHDSFGEIALLRDVPRTATVTASVASRLYALSRSDFLAAVTGHPAAERAALDVVDAHLRADAAEPQPNRPI